TTPLPSPPPTKARSRASSTRYGGREQTESAAGSAATSTRGTPTSKSGAPTSDPPFDPTTLPPIESIGAETDIRAFLAPGVPPELTRAALRRVWTADPKIRDFVGLAENAWDFNAPNAIAGFGPLDMPEELRQRLIDMVGGGLTPTPDVSPAR